MKHLVLITALALTVFVSNTTSAQSNYPPKFDGAVEMVYKTVGDTQLKLYIFNPKNHNPAKPKPAIVFFFGGGWRSGTPGQFEQQCRYLASRGMVAITADYRVASRHGVKAVDCVRDAKSAIRYVRQHAKHLGIDPNRVAAGGGSAGGHLAASVGALKGFDEKSEDKSISSVPNALALFNPAVVLAPIEGENPMDAERMKGLTERMGVNPEKLSPFHNIHKNVPPTIIFHGQGDTTVPYRTVQLFNDKMQEMNLTCQLVGYPDQPHGFFNHGRGNNVAYKDTVRRMDVFFTKLGFLKGEPTIE
ncbi:MAG: alpha/beta hydrolase [Planctomycetota bacterium]|jgi:acetyl esterase/lipase